MGEAAFQTDVTSDVMSITDIALEKMTELLGSVEEDVAGIRVFVHGGGCSGLSYGMTYAEEVLETDSALGSNECKILVDPVALGYLQGCEIDYREGPTGASFIFNNVFQSVGGSGACGGCGAGGCGT
ncbi:MAG: iron-sulfur cluster assembly accessory protein [Arenicellales bacterium]|jgi:iron-sulfur cluster assembly accessory protein